MGRQAYLTKIALGRSAFEPSQTTANPSSEYLQLESAQHDIPAAARESNVNKHIQLYDERGNPINPRAYEHGRRFREAQNDVLSSIGVVQRRRSPSEGLPESYEERLEELENENSVGNAIALASTVVENVCTWWIGSLRDRILTFRIREAVPFSQVVVSEYQTTGTKLVYAGFLSHLLSCLGVWASVYTVFELRPLDRFLATYASQKTKSRVRQWRGTISTCFRLVVELAFYPFIYHASLQRLGLLPARQLPYWKSFIPFSRWSPIRLFLPHSATSAAHSSLPISQPMLWVKAGAVASLSSPLAFIIFGHFVERWMSTVIYEAIETTIIHPNNPDLLAPDDSANYRTSTHGLRKKSPLIIRNVINDVLVTFGWGTVSAFEGIDEKTTHPARIDEIDLQQTLEIDGQHITNVERLILPPIHAANPTEANSLAEPLNPHGEEVVPGHTLPSPTASEASQNDSDPRIRITSREGIVEMEVRLPPSALIDISETIPGSPNQRHVASPIPIRDAEARLYHRVTLLSAEPSQMIGAICKSQIVGWVMMPLKLITLRLVAAHYLASNPGHIGLHPVLAPWPGFGDLSIRHICALLSRIALCGALEVAIDLGLWSTQWVTVTWVGKNYFGWGTL